MIKIMKHKKISTTLIMFLVAILSALNLLSAIFATFVTGSGMNKKQDAFLQQTTLSAKKQVEQFVEKYISVAEVLSNSEQLQHTMKMGTKATPLATVPEFSGVVHTLQNTKADYEDILNLAVGSIAEDYIYTQDGKRLDVLLSERAYFDKAQENTYVTQPYIDTLTNQMCVSITTPIKEGKKTVGILILDLKLTQVSTFLEQMSFGNSGRIILLSNDNTIIGYENHDLIGQKFENMGVSGKILTELESPSGQIIKYNLQGSSRVGTVQELSGGGWKVLSAMNRGEYNIQTIKTVLILVLFLVLDTIAIAIALRSVIIKKLQPISELNHGLKEMSEGNLKISILHEGEDEVGEMADSMRSCLASLSSYVGDIDSVMESLAMGDLAVKSKVEFKGDFIPIQNSIFAFIEKLTDLMRGISQASEQVSSGSEQVSLGGQALAAGATEQASSVEELAATIAEISTTVQNNSEIAQAANKNVTHVNDEIVESNEKMNHTLELMTEIRSSANEVSGIVKTIEEIAFQTNIVALNAAVEAARAGQAGKGFAVVADEVRDLAAKSSEASKATSSLIGSMLASIEKGSRSMQETKQYMDNVVAEAVEITGIFQKISEASEHQAKSILQVTQGTDEISSVVLTNSATAEESAAASEELSSQAQILMEMIGQFHLPEMTE